jgi:hypothetical protein
VWLIYVGWKESVRPTNVALEKGVRLANVTL